MFSNGGRPKEKSEADLPTNVIDSARNAPSFEIIFKSLNSWSCFPSSTILPNDRTGNCKNRRRPIAPVGWLPPECGIRLVSPKKNHVRKRGNRNTEKCSRSSPKTRRQPVAAAGSGSVQPQTACPPILRRRIANIMATNPAPSNATPVGSGVSLGGV
jgi:hypothetical protein